MKEWAVNSGMYLAMTAFANSRHSSLWKSTESSDVCRIGAVGGDPNEGFGSETAFVSRRDYTVCLRLLIPAP